MFGVTCAYVISVVVSFDQEYQCHTSMYNVRVRGLLIFYDMYTIGCSLVMVLWKQCLRQGVACSCDKNNNLVAHFIGSIYHVCICGYFVFLLLMLVVFCSLLLDM